MVVIGQKWLYSGKSGCFLEKWYYSGKSGRTRLIVVVFG